MCDAVSGDGYGYDGSRWVGGGLAGRFRPSISAVDRVNG